VRARGDGLPGFQQQRKNDERRTPAFELEDQKVVLDALSHVSAFDEQAGEYRRAEA
jgi:hypothetical protein